MSIPMPQFFRHSGTCAFCDKKPPTDRIDLTTDDGGDTMTTYKNVPVCDRCRRVQWWLGWVGYPVAILLGVVLGWVSVQLDWSTWLRIVALFVPPVVYHLYLITSRAVTIEQWMHKYRPTLIDETTKPADEIIAFAESDLTDEVSPEDQLELFGTMHFHDLVRLVRVGDGRVRMVPAGSSADTGPVFRVLESRRRYLKRIRLKRIQLVSTE